MPINQRLLGSVETAIYYLHFVLWTFGEQVRTETCGIVIVAWCPINIPLLHWKIGAV